MAVLLMASVLTLPSCKIGESLGPIGGTYVGTLNGQEVTAQLKRVDAKKLILTVSPSGVISNAPDSLTKPIEFKMKIHLSGELDIKPDSKDFPVTRFKSISSSCYISIQSYSRPDSKLDICWDGETIHVAGSLSKSRNFSLHLMMSRSDEMPDLEPPAWYTVAQLIDRAKERNFEKTVEYQKVLQARAQSKLVYLSLIPHLSLADGLSLLSSNYFNALRALGDFVPFLFPSRWIKVSEAKDLLIAEKQAWIIMDLNGIHITEGLARSTLRDHETLNCLAQHKLKIATFRNWVESKEAEGILRTGSSDDLRSLEKQIEASENQLNGILDKKLAALSHAAGFYNPRAIIGVHSDSTEISGQSDSVLSPFEMDMNVAFQMAIDKSAELQQVLAMVQWAKDNRNERIFNWSDFFADPISGLGFSYPAYLQVSFHKIDEMLAAKELLKSRILEKVFSAMTDLKTSAKNHVVAMESEVIQARRVSRLSDELQSGKAIVMSDLVLALQDHIKAKLEIINTESSYVSARIDLNRLLYRGNYEISNVERQELSASQLR